MKEKEGRKDVMEKGGDRQFRRGNLLGSETKIEKKRNGGKERPEKGR